MNELTLNVLREERIRVIELADKAKTEAWKLHQKLLGSYDNADLQMQEMQKMGKLAKVNQDLINAAWAYYDVMSNTSS